MGNCQTAAVNPAGPNPVDPVVDQVVDNQGAGPSSSSSANMNRKLTFGDLAVAGEFDDV